MAEIVLGLATSHGPMLVTEVSAWGLRLAADRAQQHPWRGRHWSFDALVGERADENLDAQSHADEQEARRRRCLTAIETLADRFAAARVDVALIVGNDQEEMFDARLTPAFALYCGATIPNHELSPARLAALPPGIDVAVPGYIPSGGADYAGAPDLACQLGAALTAAGFDIAVMHDAPKDETPHAFGFVYRHLMRDRPVPSILLLINTFYPPNQPPAARCVALGKALSAAIADWPADLRVAVIASGGLSHFVIDEALDHQVLDAILGGEAEVLGSLDEATLQSGSSEIKNWLPVARALETTALKPELIDYVPCYRSAAGTGNAMGFVAWTEMAV